MGLPLVNLVEPVSVITLDSILGWWKVQRSPNAGVATAERTFSPETQVAQMQSDVVRSSRKAILEPIRFGEYLLERNAITNEQLLDALADHWASGGRLGATVARRGYLQVDEVERLATEYHDLQVVEVEVEVRRSAS